MPGRTPSSIFFSKIPQRSPLPGARGKGARSAGASATNPCGVRRASGSRFTSGFFFSFFSLPLFSPDRVAVEQTLANIRFVLARRHLTPR